MVNVQKPQKMRRAVLCVQGAVLPCPGWAQLSHIQSLLLSTSELPSTHSGPASAFEKPTVRSSDGQPQAQINVASFCKYGIAEWSRGPGSALDMAQESIRVGPGASLTDTFFSRESFIRGALVRLLASAALPEWGVLGPVFPGYAPNDHI